MKTLVVVATHAEAAPLIAHFGLQHQQFASHTTFDLLVTGVGMTATAFAIGRHLSAEHALILNLGIAGSFDISIPLGTVLNITTDVFAELGAAAPDGFISIDTLGFGTANYKGAIIDGLQQVNGITVNKVNGNSSGIAEVIARLHPQTESMEGAAAFYCAAAAGVECLQVRSISNFVAPRNKDNWNIGLAVKNLNLWAIDYLTTTKNP